MDYWQRPIPVDGGKFFGDVGFAGPHGGKGGKFLLLPLGYKGAVRKAITFTVRGQTTYLSSCEDFLKTRRTGHRRSHIWNRQEFTR